MILDKYKKFAALSPCDFADGLPIQQFMHFDVRELWPQIPTIAGPAFTVKCDPGDHLMLHAAIYQAQPGDIIVVEATPDFAVAGGNVCAIAQQRGIAGFVVDGVVRDLGEIRELRFPVFARGVIPKPGAKKCFSPLNQPITCAGVKVNAGDIIVANEEGIAVIPSQQSEDIYQIALARMQKDTGMTLDEWRKEHQNKVESLLEKLS